MRAILALSFAALLAGQAAAAEIQAEIKTFQFQPKVLTVHVGDTVTWTNNDGADHSVTAAGVFDTGLFGKGESRSLTFDTPGTFPFRCSRHGSMTGEIVVVP
jgi:plastocyanin